MVQRKAPHKIGSELETKRIHVKLERQSSSHNQQQDTRSKGGGNDPKKKMKLERSIMAADLEILQDSPMNPKQRSQPNYMKPTSSWDARKEQLQVTRLSPAKTDKKRSSRNSKNSNSSCSLSRQSSLKAIRPLMNLMKGVVVNRATCSSTLKESKFPEALDLNPEGTSVMRVCPYTYCSLNGHRHEPLPPLKCFMSARRKLLKTQKSLKLKGLSSLRIQVLGKDKKGRDTGQKARMEEVSDDFFIEIYDSNPAEDDPMKETHADTIVEDGLDQSSELSDEEVDVLMSFREYVVCDQQVDDAEKEEKTILVPEDNGELRENKASTFNLDWEEEGSSLIPNNTTELSIEQITPLNACDVSEADEELQQEVNPESGCDGDGDGISPCDELSIEPITDDECAVDEADAEFKQEVNQESGCDGDDISPCEELSIEPITDDKCSVDEADAEFKQEVHRKVAEINDALARDDGNLEGRREPITDAKCSVVDEADAEFKQEVHHKVAEINDALARDDGNLEGRDAKSPEGQEFSRVDVLYQEPESSEYNDNTCFQGSEEVSEEPEEGSEAGHALLKYDNDESGILKHDGPEEQQNLLQENIREEENPHEVEDTDSLSIVQLFDSCDELEQSDQGMTEDDIRNQPEMIFKCDGARISSDIQSFSSSDQSDENDIEESWESENEQQEKVSLDGSIPKLKARIRITRKKIPEEPDEIREFNPRSPWFLDVEPDPEAEKVDLRHQMMDERKNSEEYLIDYALRQAVTKLAPARKRKVALLVEAFETVMPLPVYEKPLRHATSGFIHARIMQACS